jgi:hypothetical protein
MQKKRKRKKGGVRGMNRVPYVAGVPLSKSVPGNHCAKFSIPHIGRCFSAPFKRNGANIKPIPRTHGPQHSPGAANRNSFFNFYHGLT